MIKAKIPVSLRPVIPTVLTLGAGVLAGFVGDVTSALAAAAIGAFVSLLYDIASRWDKKPAPPA